MLQNLQAVQKKMSPARWWHLKVVIIILQPAPLKDPEKLSQWIEGSHSKRRKYRKNINIEEKDGEKITKRSPLMCP